jgi:hypothetical protein
MKLEWDEKKRQQTMAIRGLDFADCGAVLCSEPRLERLDSRREYGETRCVVLGFLHQRLVVILYTKRADAYRIISMRKANSREVQLFQQTQKRVISMDVKKYRPKKGPNHE